MTIDPVTQALDLLVPPFDSPDRNWEAILDAASRPRMMEVDPSSLWPTGRRSGLALWRSRWALVVAAALMILGAGTAAAVTIASSDGSPEQLAPTTGSSPSLGGDAASIIASAKARVPDVLSVQITND